MNLPVPFRRVSKLLALFKFDKGFYNNSTKLMVYCIVVQLIYGFLQKIDLDCNSLYFFEIFR